MGVIKANKKKKKVGPEVANIERIEMKENKAIQEKYGIEDQKKVDAIRQAYLLLRLRNGQVTN